MPNKILILTVSGEGYQGKLAIAKDSSQVILPKEPSMFFSPFSTMMG